MGEGVLISNRTCKAILNPNFKSSFDMVNPEVTSHPGTFLYVLLLLIVLLLVIYVGIFLLWVIVVLISRNIVAFLR